MNKGEIMISNTNTNINKIEADAPQSLINYDFDFFTVSTNKLIFMSICTFGFYELYWFYKNWVAINRAGGKCRPFWRTFFAPLFAYSCFEHIRKSMVKHKIVSNFQPGVLATFYFILQLSSRLHDPYSLIYLCGFLPILGANDIAIAINKARNPEFINNETYSKWNIAAIFLGSINLILIIIGLFISQSR